MIISKFNKSALEVDHQYSNREMFNMTLDMVKGDYLKLTTEDSFQSSAERLGFYEVFCKSFKEYIDEGDMEDLVPDEKQESGELDRYDVENVIDIIKIKAEIPSYVDGKQGKELVLDDKDLKAFQEE